MKPGYPEMKPVYGELALKVAKTLGTSIFVFASWGLLEASWGPLGSMAARRPLVGLLRASRVFLEPPKSVVKPWVFEPKGKFDL